MGRKVLISNCHADKRHNLTDTVILNATTTAKSTPIADGAFYVTTVRELQSVQNPNHNFLYYDKATNEICALDYTQSDLVADLSHTHVGNARGGVGEVQLSSGAGTFKSHAFLTYDDSLHALTIGDTTMHTFVMDATAGKFASGKFRPLAGKHDLEVNHSNLQLHLLDSYALGSNNPLNIG